MSDDIFWLDVSALTADTRDLLKKFIARRDTPALLKAMADLDHSLAIERHANSYATRAAAQRESLEARNRIAEILGSTDLEKRRLYAHGAGLPEGARCEARDFDRVIRDARNKANDRHRAVLREARQRHMHDNQHIWGVEAAAALIWEDNQHQVGLDGPLKLSAAAEEAILSTSEPPSFQRVKRSGVSGKDGPIQAMLLVTARWLGIESADNYGVGDIPDESWRVVYDRFMEAVRDAEIVDKYGKPWTTTFLNFKKYWAKSTKPHYVLFQSIRAERHEENLRKLLK